MKAAGFDIQCSQAHPADRDAVAGIQRDVTTDWNGDGDPSRTLTLVDGQDSARGFYQTGKHLFLIRSSPTRGRGGGLLMRNPDQTVVTSSLSSGAVHRSN